MAGSSMLRACAICLLQASLSSGLGMATLETSGQPLVPGVAGDRSALAEIPEHAELHAVHTAINALRRSSTALDAQKACEDVGQAVLVNHLLAKEALGMALKDLVQLKLLAHKNKPQVVSACIEAMVNVVGYNWDLSTKQAAFLPYVTAAIKHHGATTPKLIVHAAMLQDNSYKNRKQLMAERVPEFLFELRRTEATPEVERAVQCFVSSYCGPQLLTNHLAQLGYIPAAMQAMRDYRNATGIRGLILNNIQAYFVHEKAFVNELLREGIVTEILSVVQDQLDGVAEMDEMGPMSLYSNALSIMTNLAIADAGAKNDFLQRGVMNHVSRMVASATSYGRETLFPASAMPRGCPTAINLAHPPNLASRTCAVLKALAKGDGVGSRAPPPMLARLRTLLQHQDDLIRFDQAAIYECAEYGLLIHAPDEEKPAKM